MANACSFYDIPCHFEWLQEEAKGFFVWMSEEILNGGLAVLDAIPMPAWATNAGSLTLPSEVVWFASAFELHTGAGIVASAYGIRFIIRRIPVFG